MRLPHIRCLGFEMTQVVLLINQIPNFKVNEKLYIRNLFIKGSPIISFKLNSRKYLIFFSHYFGSLILSTEILSSISPIEGATVQHKTKTRISYNKETSQAKIKSWEGVREWRHDIIMKTPRFYGRSKNTRTIGQD